MSRVGPPASSVSMSRALIFPEASDLENSTTWCDTIFSKNIAVVEQVLVPPLLKNIPPRKFWFGCNAYMMLPNSATAMKTSMN